MRPPPREEGRIITECMCGTDAVVATLRDAGYYDDLTCSRVHEVLLAPHKHKDRAARKSKQSGHLLVFFCTSSQTC